MSGFVLYISSKFVVEIELQVNTSIMIQKITAYFLFSLMLFCTTKNTVLLGIYEIDQEVFINLFCINQSNPEMECNGKCQLSHIAEEQDQHNQATQTLIELQKEVFFYLNEVEAINAGEYITVLTPLVHLQQPINIYSFQFSPFQEKPPRFLS
ncbi:MAG: hypothetical protein LC105_03775 [Chitinophagales bacterium]|nr:hypothetical protein [Chitinophagales bacterium]MCZ2392961.1 hypothetical protein [Chitinophagales bacterium]